MYQADRTCPIFAELTGIFRKTIGLATLLRDELDSISASIDSVIVYGSMTSGRQDSSSDIDVLVLGRLKLIDVVRALADVGQKLNREINPIVMTSDEFASMIGRNDRFAMLLVEEPKIFVIGDEVEFGKLGENRSAP